MAAEYDIHGVGAAFQDGGHCVDHNFDALVGREKTERQNDGSAAIAKLGFCFVGLDEREIGNPVGDDFDLFRWCPVHAAQQLPAFFGHDDDLRRRLDDPIQDAALRQRRLGKNRMKRRDDRHVQPREQRHDMGAGFTTENAEFMLEGNGFELASIQDVGGMRVIFYSGRH